MKAVHWMKGRRGAADHSRRRGASVRGKDGTRAGLCGSVGRAEETARRTAMGSGTLKYPRLGAQRNRRNQQPTELASPRRSAKKPLAPTSRHRAAAPTASAPQRRRPMDNFHDGQYVWLRSHVHGKYLSADSDGRSVSLRRGRASLKAAWGVHIIYQGVVPYVLLYSAAYGRYLAATATPAPVAHLGYRAEQRDYDQPEVPAIRWRASEGGFSHESVLLRDANGRYLRANGKHTSAYLRWNKGVTVDRVDRVSTMMYWTVEPIPLRGPDMPQPDFAAPIPRQQSRILQELSVRLGQQRGVWRLIRFVIASPEGDYAEDGNGWTEFHFGGRYVNSLRNQVSRRLNAPVHPNRPFAMCARAGRYGRLIPLMKNLPHGGLGETLRIVVYLPETPAYNALRHPDVNAA